MPSSELLETPLSNSSLSMPVGVQLSGECQFDRAIVDVGAGEGRIRRAFILPNPNEELLLLGWMAVRKGRTRRTGGIEDERESTEESG